MTSELSVGKILTQVKSHVVGGAHQCDGRSRSITVKFTAQTLQLLKLVNRQITQ